MKLRLATLAGAAALVASSASHALTFNFSFVAGTPAQAQQAFIDAGARWSTLFNDNVTLDMTVGQQSLGAGVLVSAGSRRTSVSYTDFRNAMTADQFGASDALAVAALPSGSSFGLLINRTSDNPNGNGSATPYLDASGANNSTINVTTANAKALGLPAGTGTVGQCTTTCDASIVLGSGVSWDYDPTNGITPGAHDFVGVATHEIGHALGFISGVDVLDINSPPVNGPFTADQFTFVNSLDMFRYSALSVGQARGAVIDFTADTRAKYFSLDTGATAIAGFATGRNFGDAQPAGHWKDGLGLGIMDPTSAAGELLSIAPNDVLAFDVIGWNLAPIPEPETYALFAIGLLGLAWRRRAMRRD